MARVWERVQQFLRKLPWYRFAAGVVAGAGALFVTFLLRSLGLGVFLPEIAVDFTVGRIPGQIESFFIHTLGEGAKFLALLTALAVFLVLPGIYATFFRRVQRWLKKRWYVIAFYAFSSAGLILVVILPLLAAGFFGSATFAGFGFATFSQLLGSWVYAALLDYLLVDVAAEHPTGFNLSRRQFIAGTIAAVAVTAFTLYGLASLVAQKGRLVFASVREMMDKEQTPTQEFYVVTKNVIDPTVDAGSWRLSVGGLVANPSTYSYSQLLGLAAMDEFVTLECVSNEVGGNLISTAKWTGLRLSTLLQSAGVDPAADWVVFTCADDYTAAIPKAKAMDPATMVAVKMNDLPLAGVHGFPARIIVPGLYGMFHAKWITRIEPVDSRVTDVRGYWQQKGWTNSDDGNGRIHTVAIIATPPDNSVVGSPVTIGGIAFAGDRGISGVEVSTNGGGSWSSANLKLPPLSTLTWVLWTFVWTPPGSGSFKIVARAIDGSGMPQDPNVAPPFPSGSAGFDGITLLVG